MSSTTSSEILGRETHPSRSFGETRMGEDPLSLIGSCLKRIFRWRVPPNWSISDWRNEMRAEAACAAWQATCDYDQSLNVPLSIFARQTVLTSTLTRYRQEWAYALRTAQEHDPERSNSE